MTGDLLDFTRTAARLDLTAEEVDAVRAMIRSQLPVMPDSGAGFAGPGGTGLKIPQIPPPVYFHRVGKIVSRPDGASPGISDYTDARYYIVMQGTPPGAFDAKLKLSTDKVSYSDYNITATNLAEWTSAGGTHQLPTDGTEVVLVFVWQDANGFARYVFSDSPEKTLEARLTADDGNIPPVAYAWKEVEKQQGQTWADVTNGRTGTTSTNPARPFVENLTTSVERYRQYFSNATTGDVVMLRRTMAKQSDGTYRLEWLIVVPQETQVRWAKVAEDKDFGVGSELVQCNPCKTISGTGTDTAVTFDVYLHGPAQSPTAQSTPNVALGDVIGYIFDVTGKRICVTACHDDPIGTVKMWGASGLLPTDPPRGWCWCDGSNGSPDMRGNFVVGVKPGDADYAGIGASGGEKTIQIFDHSTATINTGDGSSGTATVVTTETHTERPSGASNIENRPPYKALGFIYRYK